MTVTTTRLYGLTVRSELPLYQNRLVSDPEVVDLDLALGSPVEATTEPPPGELLLHLQVDRQYYSASRVADGYLMRFYGTCDVRIDAGLQRATVHIVEGADPAIVAVLAGGSVIAFVLTMRGDPVLHASAVQVGDSALAFVGMSGMGKSTMATLSCAAGGRLITDDLLRLDLTRTPPRCALGATELRLRKAAADLSARFESAPPRRATGDDRDALAVPVSETDDLPLVAIVVPLPDHTQGRTHADIAGVDRKTGFLMLSRFPRLLGWEDDVVLSRQFQQLGEIIDSVPVYLARLPWGPPFPGEVAEEVLRAVGLGHHIDARSDASSAGSDSTTAK